MRDLRSANCGIASGAGENHRVPSPGDREREANRRSQAKSDSRQAANELTSCEGYARAGKIAAPGRFLLPVPTNSPPFAFGSGRASCEPIPGRRSQRPAPGAPGSRGRGRQARHGRRRSHRDRHVRRTIGRSRPGRLRAAELVQGRDVEVPVVAAEPLGDHRRRRAPQPGGIPARATERETAQETR
jgi:hypothetical protein